MSAVIRKCKIEVRPDGRARAVLMEETSTSWNFREVELVGLLRQMGLQFDDWERIQVGYSFPVREAAENFVKAVS